MSILPNPTGLCMCGCGNPTPIANRNCNTKGWVKGEHTRYCHGHGRRQNLPEYIEQDCGYETPCWVWQKGLSRGYGQPTESTTAHRVYYERFIGPIPDGLQLDHLCRNRACVNPAHLEPVTNAENVRRGLSTKLTYAQVDDIRQRLAKGESQTNIAELFSITPSNVSAINTGKSWATKDKG